ncbi:MAG: SMI1/KNR4 family protein, partial [Clostridia bacterium]|nr:SMI1/KNR4 family protein [Clostridia bacterium]
VNIVYPQWYTEFFKRYTAGLDGDNLAKEDEKLKRFVQRGGAYYEIADVYTPDELIEINKNILLYNDDYHTQFRDILLFADDESGHCHFLLDYGRGGEPKVKYLDDEADVVITLAGSFAEFTQKLTGEPENSD